MGTAFWAHQDDLSLPACDDAQTGETISYEELYRRADLFASQLVEHAAQRSFLIILARNNLASLIAYVACLRHEHACLLLSADTDEESLQALCEKYEPDFIYAPSAQDTQSYELRVCGESVHPAPHSDLRLLLSTSGSTGSPKLVRLSADNVLANACSIASYLCLDQSERPLTSLPLYYSYGLSVINSHLQAKACLLLTDESLISKNFWEFAKEHGASSLAGVPYTYEMLELLNFRQLELPSLRYMTQAGGKLSPALVETYAQWAAQKQIRFYVMYGQTEATARMSYLPPDETLRRPSSIGIAIPNGEFLLKQEDGTLTDAPNAIGELIYRGANVSMGYAYKRADFELGDERGGMLHTGDLARSDADGFYYITGRLNRFLKIAGNRFGLDEVEGYLNLCNIDAYCGGRDEQLIVLILDASKKKDLQRILKEKWKLARTQYKIEIISAVPRTSSGKVLYAELFAPYLK